MSNRTFLLPFVISLALAVAMGIGILTGQHFPYLLEKQFGVNSEDKKLQEVIRYISGRYVDEVSAADLSQTSIDKLLEALDPHSMYIPAEDVKLFDEALQENFEGIGVEYLMNKDTIQVVHAIPGGPSEQIGFATGDRIVKIEDSIVAGVGISTEAIYKKLRGPRGSKVRVEVLREKNTLNFEITRDAVPNSSVDAGFMLDESTGYIKIDRFSESTYKEFMEKLERMVEKEGLKDLVIDVRGNPGGYLNKAVDILNQFFREKDKLLLYTEGKNSKRSSYHTNGQAFYNIGKIAVLIDEESASASEIVAGALQDWDRATIIGRRSFGKGLVQEQYYLSDGSELRLTVARYFTPLGRCIQKPYKGRQGYENEIADRQKNGEMSVQKTAADSTEVYTTAGGKKVHGGGGISPDVFVPADPILALPFFVQLRENIEPFAVSYAQKFKQQFNMGSEEFLNTFLQHTIFTEFIDYSRRRGVKIEPQSLQKCEYIAKYLLKASLGKAIYGNEVKYRVLAANDPFVQTALRNK